METWTTIEKGLEVKFGGSEILTSIVELSLPCLTYEEEEEVENHGWKWKCQHYGEKGIL